MLVLQLPDLLAQNSDVLRSVAAFVAVVGVVLVVGRLLVVPAAARVAATRDLTATAQLAVRRLASATVVVLALALGTVAAGFGRVVAGSAVVVAALTVAAGFAAQSMFANLVSGVFIVADPKFNVGDWIEWDGNAGVIDDITFRATRVRTFDNEIITVPNGVLTTTAVTNAVVSRQRRLTQRFGVNYDADRAVARRCLAGAVEANEEVLERPEPLVRTVDLADAAVVFEVQFWVQEPDHADVVRVRSTVIEEALSRMEAAGVDPATTTKHELSGAVAVGGRERGGDGSARRERE